MKASDARITAKKHSVNAEQYDKIQLAIESAAKSGEHFIWWYEPIDDGTQNKLTIADGFIIKHMPDPKNEGPTIKISW